MPVAVYIRMRAAKMPLQCGTTMMVKLSSRPDVTGGSFDVDIHITLATLAEEHLESMASVPWQAYARAIERRAPNLAGDTSGCKIEDRYFDVGDTARWLDEPGGDILLTSFATTYRSDHDREGISAERKRVIKRPNRLMAIMKRWIR